MADLQTTNFIDGWRTSFSWQINKAALCTALLMLLALFVSAVPAFAAPPSTVPIFRAQLRVVTATKTDANSDDYVKVDLNAANRTWIESDQNDFERGITQTYDLRLHYVNQLGDINFLKIEKTGSDAWYIKEIHLIINGRTIYSRIFAGDGLWLDNSSGHSRVHFIDGSFLRAHSAWINYSSPQKPYVTPRNDMRLRIESVVGDFVAYQWLIQNQQGGSGLLMHRPPAIAINTINANTWRATVKVEVDAPLWNQDVEMSFDLRINCLNGRPDFTVANSRINVTFPSYDSDAAINFINGDFRHRMNDMMKNFTYGQCSDMNIVLSSNGDLNITPRILPPVFY